MNLKNIRFYFILVVAAVSYYSYASYRGIVFWESKVEKNTNDATTKTSHGIRRFYHK